MSNWSDEELLAWRSHEGHHVSVARMSLSSTELRHILIAVSVLVMAFAVVQAGGAAGFLSREPVDMLCLVLLSAGALGLAFVSHEFAHKYVAQSYGCWAEFRYWTYGLVLAAVICLFGVLWAAPGAVYIKGSLNKEQHGKISAAGPATNMVIGAIFIAALFATGIGVLGVVVMINLVLAGFNLIPIPPLDGSKIVKWSIPVYVGMWAAVVALALVWIVGL